MKHSFHLVTVIALVPFASMASAEGSSPKNALPDSVPVAITIDDLGTTGSEAVERTAKALREAGVADAYGFVIGSRVHDDRDNEESVRIWLRYGYQIGNHTFTHEGYDDVTTEFFEQDILANEPVLKEFARAGNDWHWFRTRIYRKATRWKSDEQSSNF